MILALALVASSHALAPNTVSVVGNDGAPRIAESRTYRIRQTVELADVPASAKEATLWVPIPADGPWQHIVDRRVVQAPSGWTLVHQPATGADMVVAVETTLIRESPVVDLTATTAGETQAPLFSQELSTNAPLMAPDAKMAEIAAKACTGASDPRQKVVRLLDAVADAADHYSKDPTKPKCGRGAAEDCMKNGGGCCTDLHSLFIAMARSQGIPTRLQFGYRLKADKEGTDYDPSYRCWVEYFLPGSGWVPTDLVVADAGEPSARAENYGRLDARRVWLWQGRGFDLAPKQAGGAIQTMLCGWAQIDGVAVDVLPAADGTPSKVKRSIKFEDLTPKPVAAK